MRKRIALCMAALVLALLGPGMALVVSRSFGLTMERERARGWGCRSVGRARGCIAATFASRAKSAKARAFVTGLIHPCDDTETRNRVA